MNFFRLVFRSFTYYLKADLVIAAGIAVAIAALAGSLLVGHSVKRNLEDLALKRLNNVQFTVSGNSFFSEELAEKLGRGGEKKNGTGVYEAVIVLPAVVKNSANEILVPNTVLLGVKGDCLKDTLGPGRPLAGREAVLNAGLAGDLNAKAGDLLVIKIIKQGFAPGDSLFGGKKAEDTVLSFPVAVKAIIKNTGPAGFSLKNGVVKPRNIFVSLDFLQEQLKKKGRVNYLLVSGGPAALEENLKQVLKIEDLGLNIIPGGSSFILESENMVLSEAAAEAARKAAKDNRLSCEENSVYLLNSLNGKAPYSIVSGNSRIFPGKAGKEKNNSALAPIILSSWAAEDTGAGVGDTVKAEYFEAKSNGEYEVKTKQFLVINIEAQEKMAGNARVPDFEGITDAKNMAGWKTPFPVDMKKVRQKDELFWDRYKAAPKALISYEDARDFWRPAYSGITSLKLSSSGTAELDGFKKSFLKNFDYKNAGLRVTAVKEEALKAAQGSTDYAMLFVSLSFIIVLSALWLASYLFRLMLETRTSQAGILLALGFTFRELLKVYIFEGLFIILLGALVSLPAGIFYAGWVLGFLKPLLGEGGDFKIYIEARPLVTGLVSGMALALLSIYFGVRVFKGSTVRGLLSGKPEYSGKVKVKPGKRIDSIYALGIRSLLYSKKRSFLTAGLFASAAFVIITVAVNRPLGFAPDTLQKKSGSGGFNLIANSRMPLYSELNSREGRKKNGFASYAAPVWDSVTFVPCKLSVNGEDISCLNVNQPVRPAVLGVPVSVLEQDGAYFSSGRKISWEILNNKLPGGSIPALADANSLEWILHKKVGDTLPVYGASGTPAGLKFTASLSQSIFAGVIVISEENFNGVFGSGTGYNYFLIRTPKEKEEEVLLLLRQELGKMGYTAARTSEALSAFANVQNTYLYTFQILGGLGFLLGTFGIIAVLLQNVYKRRQEFALQAALGFKKRALVFLVAFENALLLLLGLFAGTLSSLAVSFPYILKMGNQINFVLPFLTLLGMLVLGLVSCTLAAYYSLRGDLLSALRSE